jgi:hypothetical protein
VALCVLVAGAFGGRLFGYASDDRVPVAGTERMLTASPGVAAQIAALAALVSSGSSPGEGLVSFPEGEVVNYVSGRVNPIRHKLYIPGYLTDENEDEIVGELERARPRFALIWIRPTGEYGRSFFGQDYGAKIRRFLEANYDEVPLGTRTLGRRLTVYRRR